MNAMNGEIGRQKKLLYAVYRVWTERNEQQKIKRKTKRLRKSHFQLYIVHLNKMCILSVMHLDGKKAFGVWNAQCTVNRHGIPPKKRQYSHNNIFFLYYFSFSVFWVNTCFFRNGFGQCMVNSFHIQPSHHLHNNSEHIVVCVNLTFSSMLSSNGYSIITWTCGLSFGWQLEKRIYVRILLFAKDEQRTMNAYIWSWLVFFLSYPNGSNLNA